MDSGMIWLNWKRALVDFALHKQSRRLEMLIRFLMIITILVSHEVSAEDLTRPVLAARCDQKNEISLLLMAISLQSTAHGINSGWNLGLLVGETPRQTRPTGLPFQVVCLPDPADPNRIGALANQFCGWAGLRPSVQEKSGPDRASTMIAFLYENYPCNGIEDWRRNFMRTVGDRLTGKPSP
jgi:hypothetical protein